MTVLGALFDCSKAENTQEVAWTWQQEYGFRAKLMGDER